MTATLSRPARPDRPSSGKAPARPTRGGRAWPYVAPAGVLLVVWVYAPLLATAVLSTLRWNLTSRRIPFVGADNYARLFTDADFGNAVLRTLEYALALMPFATVLPMAMAILLWKLGGRAAAVYRSLLFLPVVLAPVATAVSWRFLLDPLQGLVDTVLRGVGLPAVNWLGSGPPAFVVIVLVTGTKVAALNLLLYLAGLAAIDPRQIEAARMDGATEGEVSRRILVPLLGRTTVLVAFLCLVLAGQWAFVNVSVLTQGGPQGATDNIYYRLYDYGFTFFDTGLASAAAVLVVLALVPFAVFYLRSVRERAQ